MFLLELWRGLSSFVSVAHPPSCRFFGEDGEGSAVSIVCLGDGSCGAGDESNGSGRWVSPFLGFGGGMFLSGGLRVLSFGDEGVERKGPEGVVGLALVV